MYRFIFGFHRLVWCPKCTPASSSSLIVIVAMPSPPFFACGAPCTRCMWPVAFTRCNNEQRVPGPTGAPSYGSQGERSLSPYSQAERRAHHADAKLVNAPVENRPSPSSLNQTETLSKGLER